MPANTVPVFTNLARFGAGTVTAADTGYGGSGGTAPTTAVTLLAAGANGTKIDEIVIMPLGTTVAAVVNVFVFDGTTYWLFDQFPIAANTVSQTAQQARFPKDYSDIVLPSGCSLRATVTVATAAGINIEVFGSDF